TVSTVLERLRGKNMVTRSGSAAQGYRFAPSRSDDEHTSSLMLSALGSSQDREAALLKFAGNLDQGDVELLRKAFGGYSLVLTNPLVLAGVAVLLPLLAPLLLARSTWQLTYPRLALGAWLAAFL